MRTHRATLTTLLALAFLAPVASVAIAQDANTTTLGATPIDAPAPAGYDPTLGRIVVHVEDADQHPIAGATIEADHATDMLYRAVGDAKGIARLEQLPPDAYSVRVRDGAWLSDAHDGVQVKANRTTEFYVTLRPVAQLIVHVMDKEGAPVSGAECYLYGKANLAPAAPQGVTTGEDGIASWSDLAPGEYGLAVQPPAGGDLVGQKIGLTLSQGDNEQKIVLDGMQPPAQSTLKGHVTDVGGQPLAGARIDLWNDNASAWTISDKDGAYGLSVDPGTYELRLSAPKGYADAHEHDVDLSKDATRDFELKASGLLTGLVRDANGGPIGGASVALFNDAGDGATVQTDEEGRYLIELPEGEYRAQVQADGHAAASSEGIVVKAGKLAFHDETLEALGHHASGLALVNGKPHARVLVIVLHRDASGHIDFVDSALTDQDGAWDMQLPGEGDYSLLGFFHDARAVTEFAATGAETQAPTLHFDISGWSE